MMSFFAKKLNIQYLTSVFVFLFPIFGVSIQNWISDIYIILVLLSLVYVFKTRQVYAGLYKEEKILIAILLAFFSVFLISTTLAGWDQSGIYAIGTEIRFLFVIPVYLLFRRIQNIGKYLLAGATIAPLVGGVQGLIDVYYFHYPFAKGFYGHLFIGPISLLMASLIIPAMRIFKASKKIWVLSGLIILLGLTAVVLSKARSAYLGVILIGLIAIAYYLRGRTAALVVVVFGLLVSAAYFGDAKIQKRVNLGFVQATNYFQTLEKYPDQPSKYDMGSIGLRLEMWRATKYFFAEAPWFGVGRFNYAVKIKEYAKKGLVSPAIANTPHAHSVFFDMLDEKGIFGLVTALLLLYYPLYVFIRSRNASRDTAFAGIVLIIAITIFSLTESSPFVKGNFVSTYLVLLSVFFSWHIREVYSVKLGHNTVSEITRK